MYEPLDQFFDQIHRLSADLLRLKKEEETGSSSLAESLRMLTLAIESLHTAEAELRQQYEEMVESQQIAARERERYYALFDGAPDAYLVTDTVGAIQEANYAAEQLLNVSARFLKNKPLALYVIAEQRPAFRSFIFNLTFGRLNEPQEAEFTFQGRRQLLETPVSIRAVPIRDEDSAIVGIQWLLRNIAIRRHYQHQLQTTNEMLRSLYDASPLAITFLDREGLVRMWSKTNETLFGWSQNEILGHAPPHIPVKEWERFHKTLEAICTDKHHMEFEMMHIDKDGQLIPVRISMGPICDENEEVTGVITLTTDLREEYRYRAELRAIKAHLNTVREGERRRLAQELHDDVIQTLVGLHFQVNHLRNQLAPTKGIELPRQETQDGLRQIGEEMGGMVRLLRAIISDMRPPGLEAFGIHQALETYVMQLNAIWQPPMPVIELIVHDTDIDIPLPIATVLLRVTQETLRNVKHHAEAEAVKLQLDVSPTEVLLTIEDNGKGFTAPHRLTEFARNEHFGLLGMVEQVESVGGELSIRSEIAHGTCVMVKVPLLYTPFVTEAPL